jgi:Fe-S-cluster containining protein
MTGVKDFIFETFLRLTSKTVPYGFEDTFMGEIRDLFPDGLEQDPHGNYFYKIGESRTIFASHLDTVSKDYVDVVHVLDGDIIRTDGKTTLGADDKAGTSVMLWMIKNQVPGLYYFFIGEEVGCVGSGFASKYEDFKEYDRILSFDRRGTGSIITHQSCGRSCSDSFADALCGEFNFLGLDYEKDSGGVYTDSAEFADDIQECTNVSVGYYKEHTTNEHQDIKHLTALAEACVQVDWEGLPTKRNPLVYEAKPYGYSGYDYSNSYTKTYGTTDDWYDEVDGWEFFKAQSKKHKTRRSDKKKKSKMFYDGSNGLVEITTPDYNDDFDEDRYKQETGGDKYSWIMDKFLDHNLTIADLEVIGEQYLDLSITYDAYFYEYLLEQVV